MVHASTGSANEPCMASCTTCGVSLCSFESIDDRGSDVDRTALAYMKITYPQTMSFSNEGYFEFLVDNASQGAQYLEILFFRGGSNPVLYDLDNKKKIRVLETLSNYKTIIPNGTGRKRCVVAAESEIKAIEGLTKIGNNGFLRSTLGATSGRLKNGWGVSVAASYKQGNGWVDALNTQGYFYYLRVDKELGNHLISFSGFGAPQEVIQEALMEAEKKNNFGLAEQLQGLVWKLLIYSIFGLIVALIVKKNDPEAE